MLTVIEVPIADLIPYVNNARTHSDEQVAQNAASTDQQNTKPQPLVR
nr:hypothetical protein [uncultured bacterium]